MRKESFKEIDLSEVGALVLSTDTNLQGAIAFLAVLFASINVFGGYLVTNRMLKMFKKK